MAVSIDTLRHFFRGAFQNAQWALSVDDFRAYQSQLSMLTYGEMIEESVEQLLGWIELGEQDVFYDLGCGLGRLMAHVYLRTPVRAVYGIEIAESRFRQAKRMLNALKSDPHLYDGRTIELRKGDISEVRCSNATVVYMCSTCYPAELIKQVGCNLQRDAQVGLRVLTLKKFAIPGRFRLVKQIELEMSWSQKSTVYMYRLEKDPPLPQHSILASEDLSMLATDEDSWESIDIEFDSSDFENDTDETDSV